MAAFCPFGRKCPASRGPALCSQRNRPLTIRVGRIPLRRRPRSAASAARPPRRRPLPGKFLRVRPLEGQQLPLDRKAAGVAGQAAVRPDHPVAGDDDRDRVCARPRPPTACAESRTRPSRAAALGRRGRHRWSAHRRGSRRAATRSPGERRCPAARGGKLIRVGLLSRKICLEPAGGISEDRQIRPLLCGAGEGSRREYFCPSIQRPQSRSPSAASSSRPTGELIHAVVTIEQHPSPAPHRAARGAALFFSRVLVLILTAVPPPGQPALPRSVRRFDSRGGISHRVPLLAESGRRNPPNTAPPRRPRPAQRRLHTPQMCKKRAPSPAGKDALFLCRFCRRSPLSHIGLDRIHPRVSVDALLVHVLQRLEPGEVVILAVRQNIDVAVGRIAAVAGPPPPSRRRGAPDR